MDQDTPRLERDKSLLVAAIDNSRDDLYCNFSASTDKLNVARSAKESFQRNTLKWLAGTVIFGAVVVTRMLPRSKPAKEERKSAAGWAFGKAMKGAFLLAQPYLMHQIHSQVDRRLNPTRADQGNGFG